MTRKELARNLHELWERAQALQLGARDLVAHLPASETVSRLALEIAINDLIALAARAAALADLAEAPTPRRKR